MQDIFKQDMLGSHIDVDHADFAGNLCPCKWTADTKSGVVDKDIDAAADKILAKTDQVFTSGQIRRQQETLCTKFPAERFKPVTAAGDQNQRVSFK